jgi:hypothetical protein
MEDVSQAQKEVTDEDVFAGTINSDGTADKIMAAMGVLKTIGTLILSLQSTPEMLSQLETVLQPVISYTLENSIIGKFEHPAISLIISMPDINLTHVRLPFFTNRFI